MPAAPIAVVIPTYNEAENIRTLLEQLLALDLPLQIYVVDDDSPDGTAEAAETMNRERVTVIRRKNQRGYGQAVVAGFKEALAQGAELVVGIDADFSHDPARIPALIEAAAGADVVIGSRYIPDGGTINWPIHRMVLSRAANGYVRALLGMPVRDSTSGFRCYRRETLLAMDLDAIHSEGYSFLVEILYRAYLLGARIHEIPILFVDRLKGKSKISSKEIYRSIFMVLWLRWRFRSSLHSGHGRL
jgi:dolichol-phosphate mannosyltransferase